MHLMQKEWKSLLTVLSFEKMNELIVEHEVVCPTCGAMDYTDIRQFNLMFKTSQGVTDSSANEIYLRPETAQGIFVNFKNVQRSMRKKNAIRNCTNRKKFPK